MKLKRVGEPVPSPDGKWVVFAASEVDYASNKTQSHLWIVPAAGGEARRLNPTENEEERPRFSPDGKRLIFTSKATDPTQIWISDFDATTGKLSGETRQLTDISTGADGGIWSPDGKNVAFQMNVESKVNWPVKMPRAPEGAKWVETPRIVERLDYRSDGTGFDDDVYRHLFVVPATGGTPRQLTDGE